MRSRLLFVEDDAAASFAYTQHFDARGFATATAPTVAAARLAMGDGRYDAVIVDERLPDGRGIDLVSEVKERYPDTTVVVITGAGGVPLAVEAMRRGADHFLVKPASLEDLELFLRQGLEVTALRRRAAAAPPPAGAPRCHFGADPAMQRVREYAGLAADSSAPVLITGETGTGKGVLARWIHHAGKGDAAPFVDLNCAVLRGELLASELFGHARGAFTSADRAKPGLLDAAHEGSLFLDEIGAMDPGVQAQLLKVIEERSYRRLGENETRRSDFRLICATGQDLHEAARAGSFRADLLFRINVVTMALPPLRERRGDIPGLAATLLGDLGAPGREVEPAAMELLQGYDWPGNVRELRNILERALLLARGGPIARRHLGGCEAAPAPAGEGDPLRVAEEAVLRGALVRHGGNARLAAKSLGIPLSTFYRKAKAVRRRP